MPKFSKRSLKALESCHTDLQKIFNEVIKHRDCAVLEGYRGPEAQQKAFETGMSNARYGQSKHNLTPSQAVDVIPYPADFEDIERFHEFAGFVMGVASQLNIKIKWGGHFNKFFDGPHYEL